MKRKLALTLVMGLILLVMTPAAKGAKRSFPKLMVASYQLTPENLCPGSPSRLYLQIKNTSLWQSAQNITLRLTEEGGVLRQLPIGSAYVNEVLPGESLCWALDLEAMPGSKPGYYPIKLVMEYEDSRQTTASVTETLFIQVHQPVELVYDPPALPARVVEGDNVAFSLNLHNLGKGDIYHALVSFHVPGLSEGSSALAGNLEPGASAVASTSLQAMRPQQGYGPVQGYALLRYEDAAGFRYTQKIPLATVIEEKVPVLAPATAQEEDGRKALPVWIPVAGTLFLVSLLAAGFHWMRLRRKRQAEEERYL